METANVFSSSSFFHLSRGSGGGCVHTYTMEGGGGEGGLLRSSIAAIVGKKEGGRADLGYGRNGKGRGRERERGQGFLFPSPSITTKNKYLSFIHGPDQRERESSFRSLDACSYFTCDGGGRVGKQTHYPSSFFAGGKKLFLGHKQHGTSFFSSFFQRHWETPRTGRQPPSCIALFPSPPHIRPIHRQRGAEE